MSHVFVFISKSTVVSAMVLQFLTVMHPHIDMEVTSSVEHMMTEDPYAIIAIAEDSHCDLLLTKHPKRLRLISKNSILLDLNELLSKEAP